MGGRSRLFLQILLLALFASATSLALNLWFLTQPSLSSSTVVAFVSLVILLCTMVAYHHSNRHNRFNAQIREIIKSTAQGNFDLQVPAAPSEELAEVASEMRSMAAKLERTISNITQRSHELKIAISGIRDAVIFVDIYGKISDLNLAAERLFSVSLDQVAGISLQDAFNNIALHRLVDKTLASKEPEQGNLCIYGSEARSFLASTNVLRDARGQCNGALVILIEVTRMLKLENIRREFVANVSHELRTPITSIKGSIEALLDGAMSNPETARNFLNIARDQAERLIALTEDLLSLSRLEQAETTGEIEISIQPLSKVVNSALSACEAQARSKRIELKVQNCDDIAVRMNPSLIEQALINLIDNAVKYSENDKCVTISAMQDKSETVIQVVDEGPGIEEEHLGRIFERFYRADEARSRKIGGTGLGLAIVKHIAKLHGGYPYVYSKPGNGSAFSIHIPQT